MHKADPTTTPVSDIFVLPKHVVPKCHKFYDLIKFSCFINIDLAGNYRIYKDLEKDFFSGAPYEIQEGEVFTLIQTIVTMFTLLKNTIR